MQIDHVAIAVRSIDTAADHLGRLLGYTRKTSTVTNTRQQVNVLFLSKDGSLDIKLIEPSAPESPLWDFVRKGGGLHHLCFRVPDVSAACADLATRGARVIAQPAPGEAFDEHLIAFLYLGMGLNVEVIDTDSRRGLVASTAV
jgi:methylmalonyl-CoA/ethylmalonyl-CoA epimerase